MPKNLIVVSLLLANKTTEKMLSSTITHRSEECLSSQKAQEILQLEEAQERQRQLKEAQETLHQLGVPRKAQGKIKKEVSETNIVGDWRIGWSTPMNFRICCPGGGDMRRKEFEKSAEGPLELLELTIGMVTRGGSPGPNGTWIMHPEARDYGKNWTENLIERTKRGEKIPILLHMTSQNDRPSGVVGVVQLDTDRLVKFGGANNPCPEWSSQCNGRFEEQINIPVKPINGCPIKPFTPVKAGGWYATRGKPGQVRIPFEGVEEIIQALKKL